MLFYCINKMNINTMMQDSILCAYGQSIFSPNVNLSKTYGLQIL